MSRGYSRKPVHNQQSGKAAPDATGWSGFEDTPVGTNSQARQGSTVRFFEARFVRVATADFYDSLGSAILQVGMGDDLRYLPYDTDPSVHPVVNIWDAARRLDLPAIHAGLRSRRIPIDPAMIMPESAPGRRTFLDTLTPSVVDLRVQNHTPTKARVPRKTLRALLTPPEGSERVNPELQAIVTAEREGMYEGLAYGASRELPPRPVWVTLAFARGAAAIGALEEIHHDLHDGIVGQPMTLEPMSFLPRVTDPRV